jgi:hypothetical protein
VRGGERRRGEEGGEGTEDDQASDSRGVVVCVCLKKTLCD